MILTSTAEKYYTVWDTYSFCAISKRNAPIRVTVTLIRVCSSIYVAVDIRYERG